MEIDYKSDKLSSIFSKIHNNKLIVPNFQREFVWERDDQKKLLASCLSGIPIGSILVLRAKKTNYSAKKVGFQSPIETRRKLPEECEFLLDGQQRLACLYSAFYDFFNLKSREKVDITWVYDSLYNKLLNRWLIRIKPLDGYENIWGYAKLTFDKNNVLESEPTVLETLIECRRDLKNSKRPYSPWYENKSANADNIVNILSDEGLIPLYSIFNHKNGVEPLHKKVLRKIAYNRVAELKNECGKSEAKARKILKHVEATLKSGELDLAWASLTEKWINELQNYFDSVLETQIAIIDLPQKEVARATVIFENLNRGGTPLSTFDLVVAKVFDPKKRYSLRDKLREVLSEEERIPKSVIDDEIQWNGAWFNAIDHKDEDIAKTVKDQFLNLLSILAYEKKLKSGLNRISSQHIKKKAILELEPKQIRDNVDLSAKAIKRTLAFLQFRCGVIGVNHVIYELMILPLAYLLKEDSIWKKHKSIDKLEYWYWLSLFSGRYREQQNERCIEDLKELFFWVAEDDRRAEKRLSLESERFKNLLNVQGYADEKILLQEDEENDIPAAVRSAFLQYILSRYPKNLSFKSDALSKLRAWLIAKEEQFVEIHHIIPLANAVNIGQSTKEIRKGRKHILNSPLNLTFVVKETNRALRDFSPRDYLTKVTEKFTELPIYEHFLPNDAQLFDNVKAKPSEDNMKEYCKRRFQELKKELQKELENLFG